MTETAPTSRTRSRLMKGGGAVLGVAAIGAALTLTASQWTDQAEVQGDVEVGTFEITFGSDELAFETFAMGQDSENQTSQVTLANNSSVEAVITLTDSTEPEGFDFTVTVDGEPVDIGEGSTTVPANDSATVQVSAALTEEVPEEAEETSFTFTGTHDLDGGDDGGDNGGGGDV